MPYILEKATPANNYHYNINLKQKARYLRNNSTRAEIIIWSSILKNRPFRSYRFLRQRPILHYIADFVCLELLLVIEIDGYTHEFEEVIRKDHKKERDLKSVGFTVLRFSDWEVFNHRDEVFATIKQYVERFADL